MDKTKILLVDDDESLLRSFKALLETADFEVETANSAKQALDATSRGKFGLFIVDIVLPDLHGDELVKELKRLNENAKVVLITGYASFQESIDALELGIHDILLKPISPEELIRVATGASRINGKRNTGCEITVNRKG